MRPDSGAPATHQLLALLLLLIPELPLALSVPLHGCPVLRPPPEQVGVVCRAGGGGNRSRLRCAAVAAAPGGPAGIQHCWHAPAIIQQAGQRVGQAAQRSLLLLLCEHEASGRPS